MAFCLEFWKYLFLSGFFYFIVIGSLVLSSHEPMKIKPEFRKYTAISSYITSAVNFLLRFL